MKNKKLKKLMETQTQDFSKELASYQVEVENLQTQITKLSKI